MNSNLVAPLRRAGLGALLVGALGLPAHAAEAPGAGVRSARVEVNYRDPAKFTEMDRNPSERTDWLDELSRYIDRRASRVLAPGERLVVTITDVQLAGMFERWRHGSLANVRIVRDSTPPRIDLSFRLEAANGAVLKQGERKLHDIGFLTRSARHSGERLSYEKNLIDDWLAREIAPARR